MSFEKTQEKFLKSINDLDKARRLMNIADIIDAIWQKVNYPGLNEYIATFRIQQNFNQITHNCILKCNSIQFPKIANNSIKTRRNMSEFRSEDKKYTKDGHTPKEGVYAYNGSNFIGKSSPV